MKVCFFGFYNPLYNRNRVLKKGLEKNGVEVIECRSEKKGIKKYYDLIQKHKKIKHDYDVMFVQYPGQQAAILAGIICRKFISIPKKFM